MGKVPCRALALCALLAAAGPAAAAEFEVLHSFTGGHDGGVSYAAVIADADGALYGTTSGGGTQGDGVVFKLSPPSVGHTDWDETVLYTFGGGREGDTEEGLVFDATGNLYGAAWALPGAGHNAGVVFELMPPSGVHSVWKYKVLHGFARNQRHGVDPALGALIFDSQGSLYGSGQDNAFRLSPPAAGQNSWHLTDLALSLKGAYGSLLLDPSGTLYGTTEGNGGDDPYGSVYALIPPTESGSSWQVKTVIHFNIADGAGPVAGLISSPSGTFYGTTVGGSPPASVGTVYALRPPAAGHSDWRLKTLYTFQGGGFGGTDPTDGSYPFAPVVQASDGTLYGTTVVGGSRCSLTSPFPTPKLYGCGTIFKLTTPKAGETAWMETVLYRFTGGADGAFPYAGLLLRDGVLYGTTTAGGQYGKGTVFAITP